MVPQTFAEYLFTFFRPLRLAFDMDSYKYFNSVSQRSTLVLQKRLDFDKNQFFIPRFSKKFYS